MDFIYSSDRPMYIPCRECGGLNGDHAWNCRNNFSVWPKSAKCPVCHIPCMTPGNPWCQSCGSDHTIITCPTCGYRTPAYSYHKRGCSRSWDHPDEVAKRNELLRIEREKRDLRNKTMLENPASILFAEAPHTTTGNYDYILTQWAMGEWDERTQSMVGMLLRMLILGEKPVPGPETLSGMDDGSED